MLLRWLVIGGTVSVGISLAWYLPQERGCRLCAPTLGGPWLGTDALGRDVAVRLLRGWGLSLSVAIASALVSVALGTFVGLIAGSQGGLVEALLLLLVQALWVVPALLWAAVLAFVAGKNLFTLALAIGLSTWTETARLARVETQRLWRLPFVEAASALGLPYRRVLWQHVLPNLRPLLSVQLLQTFATAALIEAGLSFVGLGPSGYISLGTLLAEAVQTLTLPQGQIQGLLAASLLVGTVFAVYSLTGYGRNPF